MATNTTSNDVIDFVENEKPKIPVLLNVLTILTFIGSAFEVYRFTTSGSSNEENLKKLQEAQGKLKDAPEWAKKFAGPEALEIVKKSIANQVPILILGLLGTALCIYGAIEMRKLKRQGFYIWLIGELIPYVAALLFIGSIFFSSVYVFFMILPVIFILLYATQLKYMK